MSSQTKNVTMENFDSIMESNDIVILDFWAEWCGPCKMFGPIFEQAAEKNPDVFFGKVNTEEATDLSAAFRVRSIPTVMAFKGNELVFEQPGVLPEAALSELVQKLRDLDIEAAKKRAAETGGTSS